MMIFSQIPQPFGEVLDEISTPHKIHGVDYIVVEKAALVAAHRDEMMALVNRVEASLSTDDIEERYGDYFKTKELLGEDLAEMTLNYKTGYVKAVGDVRTALAALKAELNDTKNGDAE